ncbi:MAG: enoyl-CoA hydratase/isomerase family protein, partial [Acidobacteriota bacterium]
MSEVRISFDAGTGVATFTIDTAGPVNTIGVQLVADLEAAWRRAATAGARGVLIRSGKRKSFLDGANLVELLKLDPRWELRPLLERLQRLLAAMAESEIPVLGLVEGATALGGGCELLLWACDHVLATPGARLGLPEVNVGLFPAAGGVHTLPRAIPFKEALDIITGGRVLPAEDFTKLGLVTMTTPAAIAGDALAWIAAHPAPANRNRASAPAGGLGDAEKRQLLAATRSRFAACPDRPWFGALLEAMEDGLGRSV